MTIIGIYINVKAKGVIDILKKQKHQVTLKDLAQQTGYSINTISRALRGKDDISEETIKKIKQTAKEMGYINNTIASSLRLGYTNTIAVILGDISNPHFSIMTKEIENHARSLGYSSFLLNTNENSEIERNAIITAINKNVDGIIICLTQEDDTNLQFLIESKVPFIQIGRYNDRIDANYVVCDDVEGGYQAVKYLIDNGHKRILFLDGPKYISSSEERYKGYLKAFQENQLEVVPELIREVSISTSNSIEILEQVLHSGEQFTAIFSFSDSIAWEAWAYLQGRGYRVPEDISIIGYDYIQSRIVIPYQLSTISSYKKQMSITAVECLHCKINRDFESEEHCTEICHHVISTKLIPGMTVRNINGEII